MLDRPNQAANALTLLDAKKKSSFVISRWSNNRMQRSAASILHIVTSLLHAAPADAERWASFVEVGITTMPKYVAFLRAINVGGHTVKMDYLRHLFEALRFSKVETFIASGNVIFDSKSKNTKALEKMIEGHLQKTLGYEVATFIRSTTELAAIADYKPFLDTQLKGEGNVLYIAFLADEPGDEAKQKVMSLTTEVDDFHVQGRELYWLCRKKVGESEVSGAMLAKAVGMQATLRNSTTVKKIAAKYS